MEMKTIFFMTSRVDSTDIKKYANIFECKLGKLTEYYADTSNFIIELISRNSYGRCYQKKYSIGVFKDKVNILDLTPDLEGNVLYAKIVDGNAKFYTDNFLINADVKANISFGTQTAFTSIKYYDYCEYKEIENIDEFIKPEYGINYNCQNLCNNWDNDLIRLSNGWKMENQSNNRIYIEGNKIYVEFELSGGDITKSPFDIKSTAIIKQSKDILIGCIKSLYSESNEVTSAMLRLKDDMVIIPYGIKENSIIFGSFYLIYKY